MSTHLLIAAAYQRHLPQGRKLVLMAIADSGDEHTLESAPGLPKMRAWSGLTKSPVLEHVKALVTEGLVERLEAGRLGRRAVYRVFPNGVPAIPHPDEVREWYADDDEGGSCQQDPQVIPSIGDNPEEEGPASRSLGSCQTPSRVLPTGPLHATTSVSIGEQPPASPVESRRSASGFPGSRSSNRDHVEEAKGIARRARGANDQPCTIHPAMIVPCRRCTAAAVDTEGNRAAAEKARQLIRQNLTAPAPPTADPEEPVA